MVKSIRINGIGVHLVLNVVINYIIHYLFGNNYEIFSKCVTYATKLSGENVGRTGNTDLWLYFLNKKYKHRLQSQTKASKVSIVLFLYHL